MKKFLFLILTCLLFSAGYLHAQNATKSIPVGIGKNNCGSGTDSIYFFDYVASVMNKAVYPNSYRPRLRIGPGLTNKFITSLSSVSFNPKDQKLYFLWTTYPTVSTAITYVWRWKPDTTFASGAMTLATSLDTLRSFPYDLAGVAFDNNGLGWTIEFPPAPCTRAFMRPIDFAGNIYYHADTLDFIPGPGNKGATLYSVGSGDITRLPNGQMYYNFDNKLYTPDYQSWNPTPPPGGGAHHFNSYYIDTTALPGGATALVGLSYADGDLIAAYQAATCTYKKIDPVTGLPSALTYNFGAGTGVSSVDMTQIISGVGASKKLVSVTATGTPNQYDVVYDIFVKNYGSIPITNIQVKDSLGSINTNANVSNVTAVFTSNPAGLTLAGSYNGTTSPNLLNAGQTLQNYPTANNNFTIRVSCRLSNILSGVVYNNSAIATANGWNNYALRDSSTNGNNPDLNQNDKPDDVGEGQPTPFVIILTPTTPPCGTLSQLLYSQTFGIGAGLSSAFPAVPSMSCGYAAYTTIPMTVNRYALADTAAQGNRGYWQPLLTDHTGGGHGKMLLINADAPATVFYRDTLPVACPGQQYSVSFWATFVGNYTYRALCNGLGGFKYPKFLIKIRDLTTGLTITQFTTADLTDTTWQQLGMKWVMPPGYSNVILEMSNAGPGGCGNDFAIDDIQYGICDPSPTVSVGSGCIGLAVTFTSALSDTTVVPGAKSYQWQISNTLAGPYFNIVGATSSTYTINPVTVADTGKYYRIIVAALGNIAIAACQYISPGVKLSGKVISFAATSATRSKNNICSGISVNLGITGGSLGTNASWKWYTGSCGGTLAGTGATLSVTPAVTTTYYVRAEGDCNNTGCQTVTVTINCNIDKDKDGIPDWVESNIPAAFQDANSNGIINAYDPTYPGFVDNNNDYINDNFQADGDSDGDGIPNYLDLDFPGRIDANADGVDDRFDTDKDGVINMLDLDSDNDGIPDVVEAYGVDVNGDGKIDNYIDADGDGLSDQVDGNVANAYNSGLGLGKPDFDGDGVPNYLDLDSDNDGIPDLVEVGAPDVNNNGMVDVFVDANGDGLADAYINATALLKTGADINNDGKADSYPNKNLDNDAKPNAYDMDSDGDGIVDVIEAGLPDANLNGIVDGIIGANGWSTTVSVMPGPLAIRSTDGDGKPDYLDIDSDNDGIPDNIEGQSTAGYLLPSLTDTDGDGLSNTYDNIVGFGGSGIFVYDNDMDGTPDYRDLDSDGDGQPDRVEGNDFNMNGIADEVVSLTGLDTDGDGLDNRFDSLNSTINVKGTSYRMGNGGTFAGDATPGARCTLTKKFPTDPERAWRFVGVILPVQFLQLTGVAQANNVILNWSIIAAKDVDHFEVERSTDNSTYIKTGIVTLPVKLNEQQNFTFTDNIANINKEVIYYRIRVIGKAGEIQYSNIIVVRMKQIKTLLSIMPNPASDKVSVIFFSEKDDVITLRLIDNLGKIVLIKSQKIVKGINTLQLTGLNQFSNGVYSLQVFVNGEVVTQKLVIAR